MIPTCYSPVYAAETPTTSMRKLAVVASLAVANGYAKLIEPPPLDPACLTRLHYPAYVEAFLHGREPLASAQGWDWTPAIRDGVLAINAGQIAAAQLALQHGLAANLAQGFHHATYTRGRGYCTFNGLALVAQEFADLKIGVLDCDEHQGNGTAEFTLRLDNLYNFSIYGTSFSTPAQPRSVHRHLKRCTDRFEIYLSAVEEGLAQMHAWGIDLLIYQAGADPHQDDPLGSLGLTTAQLRERDALVFTEVKASGWPMFFVLAGGYQEPIKTRLAPLHLATFAEAYRVYFT